MKPTCRLSLLHRLSLFLIGTTDEIVKADSSFWREGQLTRPRYILFTKVYIAIVCWPMGRGAWPGVGGAIQLINMRLCCCLGSFVSSTGLHCPGWGLTGYWWKLSPAGEEKVDLFMSKVWEGSITLWYLFSVCVCVCVCVHACMHVCACERACVCVCIWEIRRRRWQRLGVWYFLFITV